MHAGSLLPRRSERLQQRATGGSAAAQELPPVSTEQRLQLLERELLQAGVQWVCGLRLQSSSAFSNHTGPTYFEGCVRRCKFSGSLWVRGAR